ncbi:entericidin EcnA/B family protein [Sphingomonas sp. C3-2]|nr:entericidin EcnA/B family protein [Sphingomonas sp. C3-2]WOK36551.1 entericidin EcnA/B family protein [Sphingomonas sp. C3-2]
MKRIVLVFALLGSFTVAACNTVSGAGDDLKSASETVENEIN